MTIEEAFSILIGLFNSDETDLEILLEYLEDITCGENIFG